MFWRLGFGPYEERLMRTNINSTKCLMLLKYLIMWNKQKIPVWSYYLKTVVIKLLLNPPYRHFWDSSLANIFTQCLLNLQKSLHEVKTFRDIFDNEIQFLGLINGDGLNNEEKMKCAKMI